MPAKQRLRSHEEGAPALTGQEAAGGREERPIRRPKRRTSDLAAQNRELVTKHHDLELLELFGATAQQGQLDQPAQGEVEKRGEQARPPGSKGQSRATLRRRPPSADSARTRRGPPSPQSRSSLRTPHPVWRGDPAAHCPSQSHISTSDPGSERKSPNQSNAPAGPSTDTSLRSHVLAFAGNAMSNDRI